MLNSTSHSRSSCYKSKECRPPSTRWPLREQLSRLRVDSPIRSAWLRVSLLVANGSGATLMDGVDVGDRKAITREVFRLGSVRTPILGRPRPSSRERRADHPATPSSAKSQITSRELGCAVSGVWLRHAQRRRSLGQVLAQKQCPALVQPAIQRVQPDLRVAPPERHRRLLGHRQQVTPALPRPAAACNCSSSPGKPGGPHRTSSVRRTGTVPRARPAGARPTPGASRPTAPCVPAGFAVRAHRAETVTRLIGVPHHP